MLDSFTQTYADRAYGHPTMVRHQGSVLAFAMGEDRRIFYTTLDPSQAEVAQEAVLWLDAPRELNFPGELADVGFAVLDQVALAPVRKGSRAAEAPGTVVPESQLDTFLSSTARLTADAPFQVVSDGGFVYVFRQSITAAEDPDLLVFTTDRDGAPVVDEHGAHPLVDATLLVDRFMLVDAELQPKREIRFQRSRSRTRPQSSKDSLGAADLDHRPFVEPTQALRFVSGLHHGRFAVVLVPTQVADVSRWQIFVDNAETALVDLYGVERSTDGLFNTHGTAAPAAAAGVAAGALAFDREGDRLEFGDRGVSVGDGMTVEAWLKVPPALAGERTLVMADALESGPGLVVALREDGALRVALSDGSADVLTGPVLKPGAWHHVAIAYDGATIWAYADGRQVHNASLSGVLPRELAVRTIGPGFRGVLDELRVWRLARGAASISEAWNRRLTGFEPGLAGYWRFDEGAGNIAWDSAVGTPAPGILEGPTWVTSDAPVAESVGLTRTSFRVAGHMVDSGLSALLYFQQERAVAGYDRREAKPLKRSARVMLATAVTDGERHNVAAVDFGVSVDGGLAQVPTELVLSRVDRPAASAADADATRTRVAELGERVARLRDQAIALAIAEREAVVLDRVLDEHADPAELDLTGISEQLRRSLKDYSTALAAGAPGGARPGTHIAELWIPGLEAWRTKAHQLLENSADPVDIEAELAKASAELRSAETALHQRVAVRMPLVNIDGAGLSASAAILGFATSSDTPMLFEGSEGRVGLYFRGDDGSLLTAGYETLTDRGRLALAAGTGTVDLVARTVDLGTVAGDGPPSEGLRAVVVAGDADDRCTLTLTRTAAGTETVETWHGLPREPAGFADVLSGAAAVPVPIGAAGAVAGAADVLPVPAGARATLPQGTLLHVGARTLRMRAATAPGATELPVEPAEGLGIAEGEPITAVTYDYAANATTTQIPATLARGSLLVLASAEGARGALSDGTAKFVPPTAASLWIATPPAGALRLDGSHAAALPAEADLAPLGAGGDLTVESWVRPGASETVGRIVDYRGPGTSYTLALRPSPALRFDGAADAIVVPNSAALQFDGEITLEAWIQPQAIDRVRNIVAHGFTTNPNLEVYLRIADGTYQVGSWTGASPGQVAMAPVPQEDLGAWVHLAGVYGQGEWRLYRNGVLIARARHDVGAVKVDAPWTIGANSTVTERYFAGGIDEVRIWSRARGGDEIAADRTRRLTGNEPDLAGYWRPDLPGGFRRAEPVQQPPIVRGAPTQIVGPFGPVGVLAVGEQTIETRDTLPRDAWTHLAGIYHQGWGLSFARGDDALDCGNGTSLDLVGDLTIEVGVRLSSLGTPHGLVSRGTGMGDEDGVPYAFGVDAEGRLVFAFTGPDRARVVRSTRALEAGRFTWVGVTRKRSTVMLPRQGGAPPTAQSTTDIAFVIDGVPAGGESLTAGDPFSSSSATRIGVSSIGDGPIAKLAGAVSEVRVWSAARDATAIGARLKGRESGLVGWWRFRENKGTTTADDTSNNNANLRGGVRWIPTPDPAGSTLALLRDGEVVASAPDSAESLAASARGFALGGRPGDPAQDVLVGELAEVRVWRTARTADEVRQNLFRRLTDELEDVVAHYPFEFEGAGRISDHGLGGHHLQIAAEGAIVASTAPLGTDAPQVRDALLGVRTAFNERIADKASVGEYAALQTDAEGRLSGVLKRCYGVVQDGRWVLVAGFKVGDLVAEWVGQAQFDPQVIGYIEGAPPVPSENLTGTRSYADASMVTLTQADSTTLTYSSNRNTGFDMSVTAQGGGLVNTKADMLTPWGLIQNVYDVKTSFGLKAAFDTSLGWLDEAQRGQGTTVTRLSSLALRGRREDPDQVEHPALGQRFVPDNVGLALVQSETADVFALRLAHTGALVSYRMLPNPDIPKDWNLITFPIDPRYTKQGTLDGKVGTKPDRDYLNALSYSPDRSYFKPIEAYARKNRIVQEEQRLRARFEQFGAGEFGRRETDSNFGPGDFARGSLLEHLPRLEKRNLVNTYVWTAAGGLFAEEEQTVDTIREVTGGSYAFKGVAGLYFKGEISAAGLGVNTELSAVFGGHINLTVTRAVDSRTSFVLQSKAAPEADISKRDGAKVVRQPGKVDAYRYMTFYLEPEAENHDALFDQVVDPIWLASADPVAQALRQARQPGKRPPCWRIMHRVTYVSRVLEKIPDHADGDDSLDRALQRLDVDSNYELIRILDPLVRDRRGSFVEFADAVRAAIKTYLPALEPHTETILAYLVLYYDIGDSPALASHDQNGAAPPAAPPVVRASAPATVGEQASPRPQSSALDDETGRGLLTLHGQHACADTRRA